MQSPPPSVGVIANPMSGRDVRRLVARAAAGTPDAKRNQLQRILVGAAAAGAERLLLVRDLFRIAERAAASLRLSASLEFVDAGPIETRPADTVRAVEALRKHGCGALVVLGGDGTQRLVAETWPDAPLMPVSTGTNNVFPVATEATLCGAAAGLVARGAVPLAQVSRRAKVVRVETQEGARHLALIDAVKVVEDHPGNLMPFEPERIRHVLLSRAEPASVGMSPIGGLLEPCGAEEDAGVEVRCGPHAGGGRPLRVPVSPGLYRTAHVEGVRRVALGEAVYFEGPGLLEFDGDRSHGLQAGERALARVLRDGPRVIDVGLTLAEAARRGCFLDLSPFRDDGDAAGNLGCC